MRDWWLPRHDRSRIVWYASLLSSRIVPVLMIAPFPDFSDQVMFGNFLVFVRFGS